MGSGIALVKASVSHVDRLGHLLGVAWRLWVLIKPFIIHGNLAHISDEPLS